MDPSDVPVSLWLFRGCEIDVELEEFQDLQIEAVLPGRHRLSLGAPHQPRTDDTNNPRTPPLHRHHHFQWHRCAVLPSNINISVGMPVSRKLEDIFDDGAPERRVRWRTATLPRARATPLQGSPQSAASSPSRSMQQLRVSGHSSASPSGMRAPSLNMTTASSNLDILDDSTTPMQLDIPDASLADEVSLDYIRQAEALRAATPVSSPVCLSWYAARRRKLTTTFRSQ